jgi:hypothetical protein
MDAIHLPVALHCCGFRAEVTFRRSEELPSGHYRTEVGCTQCGTKMQLDLKITASDAHIAQKRAVLD